MKPRIKPRFSITDWRRFDVRIADGAAWQMVEIHPNTDVFKALSYAIKLLQSGAQAK